MSSIERMRSLTATTAATAALFALSLTALPASAQVAVSGVSGAGVTELAGTSTLVTVVLKSGATEPNCQVLEVAPTYVAVMSDDGLRNAYLFKDLQELRVQGGEIVHDRRDLTSNRPLSDAEQRLYSDIQNRASELFERSIGDQSVRMRVATILALEELGKEDQRALTYLRQRAEGNDLYTALRANLELGLIGEANPNPDLILSGLSSGLQNVRTLTMYCIGLLELHDFESRLVTLLKERAVQISAPAAFSLGQLKSTEAIPGLLDMIASLNELKAETAKEALINIGGPEVIDGLKQRLPDTAGLARFRIVEALFRLGDPLGERILKDEAMDTPTLAIQAAMVLVQQGDFEAREFLQAKLDERTEPTIYNELQKLIIASSLIKAGDRKNTAILQEKLGPDQEIFIQGAALGSIADIGERSLADLAVPLTASPMDPMAALACQVIVACLKPEYGEKFTALLSTGMIQ